MAAGAGNPTERERIGMIAFIHIAIISLVLLLPIALIALLAWYFIRLRRSKRS